MNAVEQHEANLARVEALRNHEGTVDVVALTGVGDLNVTETVGAHIEDVLTRHAPGKDLKCQCGGQCHVRVRTILP